MIAAAPNGAESSPYEIAKTMETLFHRSDLFEYDTDVQDLPCVEENLSSVECFAKYRQGYCQHYATTMAIFLRARGIPARLAEGFLPGDRDERTGIETLLGATDTSGSRCSSRATAGSRSIRRVATSRSSSRSRPVRHLRARRRVRRSATQPGGTAFADP